MNPYYERPDPASSLRQVHADRPELPGPQTVSMVEEIFETRGQPV